MSVWCVVHVWYLTNSQGVNLHECSFLTYHTYHLATTSSSQGQAPKSCYKQDIPSLHLEMLDFRFLTTFANFDAFIRRS